MNGSLRFSVIVPTLGRPGPLRITLESVLACDPAPDEVIVVDADPEGSGIAVAAELGARGLASERGMTRQRNLGLDEASGDIVVFLDDDVEVESGLFGGLARTYADPEVVGATGRIVEPDLERAGAPGSLARRLVLGADEGKFTAAGYPRYLSRLDRPADVEFMQGCFMTARRELARGIRFDEAFGGYALAEDEDFSYRLSRHGRIRYLPELRIVHKKLGYTSQDSREFGKLVIRNRSYLFRKNFPQTRRARAQFAWLILVLIAHRLVNREWRGALGLVEGAAVQLSGRE
jgi:glycosyltransferase involved in cell wall biosynthesis